MAEKKSGGSRGGGGRPKYDGPSPAYLERRARGIGEGRPGAGPRPTSKPPAQNTAAPPKPKPRPQPTTPEGEPLPAGFITSPENDKAKFLRNLLSKKDRYAAKHFLVEGVKLVDEAFSSTNPPLYTLFNPDQLRETEAGRGLLLRLNDLIEQKKGVYPTTDKIIASVSDTVTPQGIVAAVPFLRWNDEQLATRNFHLVLDGLQDPGNLGTLLRSAGAIGRAAVWLTEQSVDVYGPKVVRAGMGAHFRVPTLYNQQWPDMLAHLQKLGVTQILLAEGTISEDGESRANYRPLTSVDYDAVDWTQPTAVIVGNEAHGASREAWQAASQIITIPMPGGAESLNAAVAGSVIMFEALRQQRKR